MKWIIGLGIGAGLVWVARDVMEHAPANSDGANFFAVGIFIILLLGMEALKAK